MLVRSTLPGTIAELVAGGGSPAAAVACGDGAEAPAVTAGSCPVPPALDVGCGGPDVGLGDPRNTTIATMPATNVAPTTALRRAGSEVTDL